MDTSTRRTPAAHHLAPDGRRSRPRRLGWVIVGSVLAGGAAALLLAAAPFVPATESGVTGALLLGLALGWLMLWALSVRLTDQPQRWAATPAIVMGLGGALLLAFGAPMIEPLAWVLPPVLLALAIWTVARVHRRLPSRSGRALLYPVLALLTIAALGGGCATVRDAVHATAGPAQGQRLDVGGHRLYLHCTGSGSPTVVLEPGAGETSSAFALIAPAVARDTRVCVYDRAGRGWSDAASTIPQDAAQIVADLHALLQRGGAPGPYVLAGHSFGGLYVLTFAARHPEEVAGLVLVDSTAPASAPDAVPPTRAGSDDMTDRLSALGAVASRLSLDLLVGAETPTHLRSAIDEYLRGGASARHAAALRSLADLPLVVLTAGTGTRPGWDASQDALAALSTNSLHRVVDGATHASLTTDPEHAAVTAAGILDVVAAVRTGRPLAPEDGS